MVNPLPSTISDQDVFIVLPEAILYTIYDAEGHLEALVV